MTYYTADMLPPRVPTPCGSRMVPVYGLVDLKDGTSEVQQTGEHDLFEEVQQCKDECDMQTLIRRFEAGDDSAFDIKSGVFGDVSFMQGKTFSELYSEMDDLRNKFDAAPRSYRAKFGFSFRKFLSDKGVVPVDVPVEPVQQAEKSQNTDGGVSL